MSSANWKERFRKIAESRKFQSRTEIITEAVEQGYDREIVELVINSLMDYLPNVDGFSISLEDNVLLDYNIDDEDLGDLYRMILKRLNTKIPKRKDQDLFMEGKVEEDYSVALVIEFVEWCKTKSTS
ncbi:MAG: hypothetical protein MI810_07875 [Flavobacteriales bacterium]|nr:hypothetical protein [Flavobacteriales bacterium]